MSGKAITTAATTHPSHDCTTLMPNVFRKNIPTGRRLLKMSSKIRPEAVGGSTIGIVRMPSSTALPRLPAHMARRAAKIPRKKERSVAARPVLTEIQRGLQSSS